MTDHAEARELATQALHRVFHSSTIGEVRVLCGIGHLESSYGKGWKGAGKGSNNIGAIQAGSSWKGEVFSYIDTSPNSDGTSTPYRVNFRKYSTLLDGWVDLAKVAYLNRGRSVVRRAAMASDIAGVSRALHETGYYEGFGRTVEDRIRNHHRALLRGILAADAFIEKRKPEPLPKTPLVTIPPTLRRGDGRNTGLTEAVRQLQRELQVVADGEFGPVLNQAVLAYQQAHGLSPDGVVGPKTWTALLTDDYVPEAS